MRDGFPFSCLYCQELHELISLLSDLEYWLFKREISDFLSDEADDAPIKEFASERQDERRICRMFGMPCEAYKKFGLDPAAVELVWEPGKFIL